MGRVWRATDEMLDRLVAVKEMRIDGLDPEDTRTRRERTLREARATARIDHPNVVRIYDVVDEGERLWIVMELVAGRSLEQMVVEDGPLAPPAVARIGLELVAALSQVHAGGVLHRDIKPGNVLVERRGRRVVLTDFGIAALQDAEALTMVGMLVGSPDYMAPERVSGRPQGPPSDVWSLGATLCAALGGRSPFSRATTLATLHAVLYEEPELPSSAGDLRDILAALLDKEPSTRPGLDELGTALRPIAFPEGESEPAPTRQMPQAPQAPQAQETPEPPELVPPVPPAHEESRTPVLLEAELIRAAQSPPSQPQPQPQPEPERERESEPEPEPQPEPEHQSESESEPDSVHDAIPAQRTHTQKSPPDPGQATPEPLPTAAAEPPATEAHSQVRSEAPSPSPSPSPTPAPTPTPTPTPIPSPAPSSPASLATYPTVPGSAALPPGELPGPVVPSGPRRSRRRMGFAAAGGVVVAGAAVWLIVAMTDGSSRDTNGASPSSSSSSVSTVSSPSPTVEGTSRPPSLPAGARKEAGLYAWVPPKSWQRVAQSGSEVHYTSPDRAQEIVANARPARGDLLAQWQQAEADTSKGLNYQRIRLERTTFRNAPAVSWEYSVTAKGRLWHVRLLGFRSGGTSYEISTWYHPDIEAAAIRVYDEVKKSFTPL
ncbi:serine/threonine-protein kinase [Streptomyces sp. SD15]